MRYVRTRQTDLNTFFLKLTLTAVSIRGFEMILSKNVRTYKSRIFLRSIESYKFTTKLDKLILRDTNESTPISINESQLKRMNLYCVKKGQPKLLRSLG